MLRKIFPSGVGNSIAHSFRLLLLAEGFTAAQGPAFSAACSDLIERLVLIPPFNHTRVRPHWLTVHRSFAPSANAGPASGASVPGRTRFDAAIAPATGVMSLDAAKVVAALDAEQFDDGGGLQAISSYLKKGGLPNVGAGFLVVVLLPNVATPAAGGEYEHDPADDEYHFVATTMNGEWVQVIARGIGMSLGLCDEYEAAGADFLEPVQSVNKAMPYPNLTYFPTNPTLNKDAVRWRGLFSRAQLNSPAVIHGKAAGAAGTPDNTINAYPVTPGTVEFWEGGGRFRTKVFRSAKDCLMRRRIGDPALPVRTQPVPFCVACRSYVKNVIG
jgi:hypothetical protein